MKTALRALPLLLLPAAATGCFGGGSGSTAPTTSTLVAVDPKDFLDGVPCADAPGAMRRYVATIVDVTSKDNEFALPSTGPVSCLQQAAQGGAFVVPGHWYAADIQAFDRTDIKPLGTGSPVMVDAKTGDVVVPRWTTACGRQIAAADAGTDAGADGGADAGGADAGDAAATAAARPVFAVAYTSVFVRHCAPLVANGPDTPTRVTLALENGALGQPDLDLACGDGPGQVSTFSAHVQGGSAPDQQTACGGTLAFDGLTVGETTRFDVAAFESGAATPSWATHCSAKALAGATVGAVCDPLTDKGGIEVDIPGLLAQFNVQCQSLLSVTTLVQGANAQTAVQLPPECEAPVVFNDLPTGTYTLGVATTLQDGTAGKTATCSATVSPATTTTAICVPD